MQRILGLMLSALLLGGCATPVGKLNVAAWNETLLTAADEEDGFLTLKGVRAASLLHIALHDAWQRARGGPTLLCHGPKLAEDPTATANAAAMLLASALYPQATERFAALLEGTSQTALAATVSAELSHCVMNTLLATRADDGWDQQVPYRWQSPAPGVYADFHEHSGTPAGFVFGRSWAEVRPLFVTELPSVVPPPAIASTAYADAFDEVRLLGAANSPIRSADQAHLALWWKDFAERSFNRLARALIDEEATAIADQLRLFALLNTALFNAYIAAFDSKYEHNHWRPYTAIRAAAHDGNPATRAQQDWDNLHGHTYAFPSYPSAHGTVCAAAARVLAEVFGPTRPFRMETRYVDSAGPGSEPLKLDPSYRSFASFDDAARECALSRVYLGIHFRYDSEAGYALGTQVAVQLIEATR